MDARPLISGQEKLRAVFQLKAARVASVECGVTTRLEPLFCGVGLESAWGSMVRMWWLFAGRGDASLRINFTVWNHSTAAASLVSMAMRKPSSSGTVLGVTTRSLRRKLIRSEKVSPWRMKWLGGSWRGHCETL